MHSFIQSAGRRRRCLALAIDFGILKRVPELDLVLYGATGFAGRLVAEYLATRGPAGLRWAVAGRSPQRLEALLSEIGASVPILRADSGDPASLTEMVHRTAVVCTTVGPYGRYGMPLVKACVEAGAAYCDLTGEVPFIAATIEHHEQRAKRTGARIVHACGFDSIPSDLGTLMLARHFEAQGRRLERVRFRLAAIRGGLSGGTVATLFDLLASARDPAVRRILADPHALTPAQEPRARVEPDSLRPSRDADTGQWTAPFLMAPFNTRVVRRSAAMLGYGARLCYEERVNTGRGPLGWAAAAGMSLGLGAFVSTAAVPTLGGLYRRLLPGAGEGPSRARRERGMFAIHLHGESDDGHRALATVVGNQDPGYGETAKMVAEAAICLARDILPSEGGILTPAVAMGMKLVERLRAAGMTFDVSVP